MIELAKIRIDGGTQARAELNNDTVSEYAEIIRLGGDFPAITLFNDGRHMWLADGFHRYFAYRQAGALEVPADIKMGTKRDAVLYAVGANSKHGLRRTNADKRSAVLMLLNDKEWARWTDSAIAKACCVDHKTVAAYRSSLGNSQVTKSADAAPAERTYTTKHGTEAVMNTANIGNKPSSKPSAKPEVKPDPDMPEIMKGYDLAADMDSETVIIDKLNSEVAELEETLSAFQKDDLKAELEDQIKKRYGFEQQAKTHMTKAAALDQELRYFGKIMAELRKVLNVASNSDVVAAVKKLAKVA